LFNDLFKPQLVNTDLKTNVCYRMTGASRQTIGYPTSMEKEEEASEPTALP
jgi:hypothetical protein